jgi:DNA polymerase III subunit chi
LTEVGLYHLTRSTLEDALPRLLEKAYAAGHRVLVRGTDPERLELLNRALWTYAKESFLPHGTRADGHPELQPIFLTTSEEENPNGARLLVLADGASAPDLDRFDRCLELFDGGDPEAVGRARRRWREILDQGHTAVYWQQNERGGWAKAAEKSVGG